MKKVLYLAIPVLVPGVLIAVMLAAGARQPAAWQPAFQEYTAYQKSVSRFPPVITIIAASHASRPWNYEKDIPEILFGRDSYYHIDLPSPDENSGSNPLPYPPKDIWCLLVEVHPAASASVNYQVLFAAEHLDLYKAAWVIHAPLLAPADPLLRQKVDRLGCKRLDLPSASLSYRGE